MTRWKLTSTPPHDFFLCLDINEYFDHEHTPETIFEEGFTRPLTLSDTAVIVTIYFNGNPEAPCFDIVCDTDLTQRQKEEANIQLNRMLGIQKNLQELYQQAASDTLLSPLFHEFYGFKGLARATFFEDAINRIIQTQISHKPTARKMVYGVRSGFGTMLPFKDSSIASWPTPEQLAKGDPVSMKQYGLSLRKGEYIVGLAEELLSGRLTNTQADGLAANDFYERMISIRGIGPMSAQDLMLFRPRGDGYFPSNKQKGVEKGLRRWIILSYGEDPDTMSDQEFEELIKLWKGKEALALEYLFINYVMNEKKKRT